jgi:peptidoglycan/LPS O-acetylase OafA/YrhL
VIVALAENFPALQQHIVVLALASLVLSIAFAAFVDQYVDGYFRKRRQQFHRMPPLTATHEQAPV